MAKSKDTSKQKKINVRVDFTPMVDMMMLLITFFMLCTSLAKPQTMELSMPSNDKNMTDQDNFEHRNDVTEAEYIEMIRLKTSVLLACALKIGAILGDASAEDADNLYRFGEKIGLAFQLQDDFLDVYGDPKVFGKAIGGDIVSNKKTYMLINAFNRANAQQRAELERWTQLKDFDRQEKIDAVTALYNDMGIDRLAQDKMATYYEESKKYLAAVHVPTEKKRELTAYAQQMMKRTY